MKIAFLLILYFIGSFSYSERNDRDSDLKDVNEATDVIENYVLPSSSEVFKVLNSLTEVEWNQVASYNKRSNYSNDYLLALNLGIRVADSYVSIFAKDDRKLNEMTDVIHSLAYELNVDDIILEKRDRIKVTTKQKDWDKLQILMEELRNEVLIEIANNLKEPEKATLASAGGWLEGLRIVSKSILENYDENVSTILYQPRLIEHFIFRLNRMNENVKKEAVVKSIIQEIDHIKQLCNVGWKKPVPKKDVEILYEISSKLIKEIEGT